MKEEFLHHIWKYKLFEKDQLKTTSGEKVEIINTGTHNFDSGPDFFNAKIKINKTVWAGNVEIHLKSSDWYQHNHHQDKAYDNVILQVVHVHDKEVYRTNGLLIPSLELNFNKRLLKNYAELIEKDWDIACKNSLGGIDPFIINSWIEKLTVERLEEKSERIIAILEQTDNSWEKAFYFQLASNFGFKLNAQAFELLAKSLPLNCLAKHKDNLLQVEALLFGQAGFLDTDSGDDYYLQLVKEYAYLKKKFRLKPIEKHLWKFLRSRPGNFPSIRIAQFAQLVYKSSALFSKIIETNDLNKYYRLFQVEPSAYWINHYLFNKGSVQKKKKLGKSAIDNILINTIVPFLFVYGKAKGISELQDRAIQLLENIKAENNHITKKWAELGVQPASAFDSQALIQLKNNYCNQKKCLNCQIGTHIIVKE